MQVILHLLQKIQTFKTLNLKVLHYLTTCKERTNEINM